MKCDSANNLRPEDSIQEEAEVKSEPEPKPDDYSAEVVAKSLLKKFAGRKLPAASDLKWIVSEDQVPQTILPLPNAWPVSPDDALLNGSNFNEDDVNNIKNLRKASMPVNFSFYFGYGIVCEKVEIEEFYIEAIKLIKGITQVRKLHSFK